MDAIVAGFPDASDGVVCAALHDAGFNPVFCPDIPFFKRKFLTVGTALVLLDGVTSDTDMPEICRWIRRNAASTDTLILALPHDSSPDYLQKLIEAGADDYLLEQQDPAFLRLRLSIAAERFSARISRTHAEELIRLQRDLAVTLSSSLTVDEAIRNLLNVILRIEGIDCGGVYMEGETPGRYLLQRNVCQSGDHSDVRSVVAGTDDRLADLEKGSSIYQCASDAEVRFLCACENVKAEGLIPITHDGELIAILRAVSTCRDDLPSSSRDALESIAAQTGAAVARLRAVEALYQNERQYEVLYNNAIVGLYRIAIDDGSMLACNEQYARIYGYRDPEHAQKEFLVTNHYIDPGVRNGIIRDMSDTGEIRRYETQQRRLDGSIMWIGSSSKIYPEEGFIDGVAMDITERKTAELERQKLQRHIEELQKQESLGTLAGGIAHHMNNLLQAILGSVGMARLSITGSSPADVYLNVIEQNIHRAADLSNQMLIYAGRGKYTLTPVDLNALLREMQSILHVTISPHAKLALELATDLPEFDGDSLQIRQIVMNLVENASEAMGSSGGTILVRTGTVPDVPDAVCRGPHVCLEVKDSGCGMDAITLDRIFDPFFSTKHTGRGLGLAAVQGIVRSHNGGTSVHSRPGEGTVFSVMFPVPQQ